MSARQREGAGIVPAALFGVTCGGTVALAGNGATFVIVIAAVVALVITVAVA